MADFCNQCLKRDFPEEFSESPRDLEGQCEPGFYCSVICEGCGWTLVDHTGQCMLYNCAHSHGYDGNPLTLGSITDSVITLKFEVTL